VGEALTLIDTIRPHACGAASLHPTPRTSQSPSECRSATRGLLRSEHLGRRHRSDSWRVNVWPDPRRTPFDMTAELKTLRVTTRRQWRMWLAKHHTLSPGVWLVFFKAHTAVDSIPYEDMIREALCFGWIDSLVKRLDDDRYAIKVTPRKRTSKWSDINRKRWREGRARARSAQHNWTQRGGEGYLRSGVFGGGQLCGVGGAFSTEHDPPTLRLGLTD
jgi:hypothetical protein